MKYKHYIFFFSLLMAMTQGSFAQKNKDNIGNDDYEVQFIRTGVEGTILFKVYSYGRNENDCIKLAKKNAIKAVLFDGIPGSDLQRPMVTDPGALELHREYFNAFFQEDGKYLRFVSISTDGSIDSNDRLRVGKKLKVGIAVLVQKASLRKELEAAGVIKRLGDGF